MHGIIAALALVQGQGESTLWQSIIESFPTDPASLFTLALALGATVLVVVTGRRSNGRKGSGKDGLAP